MKRERINVDLTRIKYRYLLNNPQYIRNQLGKLEEASLDLYGYTKGNVLVDDEVIAKESFDAIKENFQGIKNELREKLIFSVSKKI